MRNIRNWKARRAGGRMTITGVEAATGQPFRMANFDTIEAGSPWPVATHRDGEKFELGSTAVPA